MHYFTRFKNLISGNTSTIRGATITIAAFMFLSQVLGLVRDRLFASVIGPGPILDAYYAAFKIPDIMLTIGGTLVSVTILLPFITKLFSNSDTPEGQKNVSDLMGMILKVVGVGFICVWIILHIAMPWLVSVLYQGFDISTAALTTNLARIMMLSPLCFIIANLFANITQYSKRFVLYAMAPVIYNAGIVFGIAVLYPHMGPQGLAIGVILGAALQILLHVPALVGRNIVPNLVAKIDWSKIKEITFVAIPRTIGLVSVNVNSLIISSFATFAGSGGLSRLSMALLISNTPLALVSTSYATAVFPDLVKSVNDGDTQKTNNLLIKAISDVSLVIFLIVGIGLVLRTYGIRILLGAGAFSWADTKLVSAALFIFLLSLPAQAFDTIALRLYYAKGETWRPMWRNIVTVLATLVLTFSAYSINKANPNTFNFLYDVLNVPHTSESLIVVIAFAYLLSSCAAFLLLWIPLVKEYLLTSLRALFIVTAKSAYIAFLAGAFSWIALQFLASHIVATTLLTTALVGIPAGVVGLIGAFIGFKVVHK